MENYLPRTCPRLPWMVEFHSDIENTTLNAQLKAAFCSKTIDHASELHIASKQPPYKLTQIMGTIGSSSNSPNVIKDMMAAGMTLARIKMLELTHEDCHEMISNIRKANDAYSKTLGRVYSCPIALYLKGPDIRIGSLKDPEAKYVEFVKGQETTLTTDPTFEEYVTGDTVYVDYPLLGEVIHPGDNIILDDGSVTLTAVAIAASIVRCIVEKAGRIGSRARVNLSDVPLNLPSVTPKDKEDLIFAAKEKVDMVFVSCTKYGETINKVREILTDNGGKGVLIIAKIENVQSIYRIEEIMKAADAVMLMRSAITTCLPMEKMFLAQKSIIARCNKAGMPVFVTQMIASAAVSRIPEKSEVASVTAAILDGADCLVTAGETTIGKYPVNAIKLLTRICMEAESAQHYKRMLQELTDISFPIETSEAICMAAVDVSFKTNAAVIIVCSVTGRSAAMLAKYRPKCPIIAVTRAPQTARILNMYRAVYPLLYLKAPATPWEKDVDHRIQFGITFGKYSGFIRAGDVITVLMGSTRGAGYTNTVKLIYASEFDVAFKKK